MDPNKETPVEQQALEAVTAALEAAEPTPAPDTTPAPEGTPPEGTAPEGAAPNADTPAPDAGEAPKGGQPEGTTAKADEDANAAIEAEMNELGLKARSRERFHKLSAENAALRPVREALEAAGIKDVAELPNLIERAQAAEEFQQAVASTGVTPQDFGQTMDILSKLNSGDPEQMNAALEQMEETLVRYSAALGRTPKAIDPLANDPDLQEAVETGEITQKHALELARVRTMERINQQSRQTQTQESAQKQVHDNAVAQMNAWEQAQLAKDAEGYMARRDILLGMVKTIRETLPPEAWQTAIERSYAGIPLPPKAPAPAPAPLRPSGVAQPGLLPQTNDPMEALQNALAAMQ